MEKKVLKSLKDARTYTKIGVSFWFLQTLYFLIEEGWHTKAISDAEKTCDAISSILFGIAAAQFGIAIYYALKLYAESNEAN